MKLKPNRQHQQAVGRRPRYPESSTNITRHDSLSLSVLLLNRIARLADSVHRGRVHWTDRKTRVFARVKSHLFCWTIFFSCSYFSVLQKQTIKFLKLTGAPARKVVEEELCPLCLKIWINLLSPSKGKCDHIVIDRGLFADQYGLCWFCVCYAENLNKVQVGKTTLSIEHMEKSGKNWEPW